MTSTKPINTTAKLPAWSYGENESSPWTPECILTSVLTNTSQLEQKNPGQPGRHSTGCVHRLAGQELTCWTGDFPSNKKPVTVWHQADHVTRNCSAPWWTLSALPKTWQRLTTSPSAVTGIGRAQFDEYEIVVLQHQHNLMELALCQIHISRKSEN